MSVPQAVAMLDQTTADRLSAGFHRCFSEFVVEPDLFAADTFFDLLPPMCTPRPARSSRAGCISARSGPAASAQSRPTATAAGTRSYAFAMPPRHR